MGLDKQTSKPCKPMCEPCEPMCEPVSQRASLASQPCIFLFATWVLTSLQWRVTLGDTRRYKEFLAKSGNNIK